VQIKLFKNISKSTSSNFKPRYENRLHLLFGFEVWSQPPRRFIGQFCGGIVGGIISSLA
jgi:hypothetical protein